MLTRDLTIEDFDTRDWVRLIALFRPPERPPSASRGAAVFVVSGGQLVKAFHSETGRLEVDDLPWPAPLEELGRRTEARWAARIESEATYDVMDRFAAVFEREHDLTAQFIRLVRVLREVEAGGGLEVWPRPVRSWPVLGESLIDTMLDALCPDGRALVLGAFEDGEVATAIALRRNGPGFDRIVGPEQLRRDMGLVSGDWTRDYRHLARAVSFSVGPLALGCFAEVSTFRELALDPSPGAWTAAVAVRDVVLHPVTPGLAVPLGIDMTRAAYVTVRGVLTRLGLATWVRDESPIAPLLESARDVARGRRDLESIFGFDPLVVIRHFIARDDDDKR